MNFPALLQQKAAQFISTNSSGLLTAGGVVGVVGTAVLTARATLKARDELMEKHAIRRAYAEAEAEERRERGEDAWVNIPDYTRTEIVKMTWKYYVPPVVVGSATIASIVMANRVSAKRAAALAVAYGISEQRLTEYKNKVQEKFGANKAQGVRDDIAQDRVTNNPPSKEVVIIGNGDVLCYDSLSGRYFHSSVEQIKKAETNLNAELFHHQYASLSSFYDDIGLPPTPFSEELGWNTMSLEPLEIKFSTTITPDNRPCLVLDYSTMPAPDYHRLY